MIFVDLPVGTGFSYSKTYEASRSSDSGLAFQSYEFIQKWLVEHPKFLDNPLYISGISYMGIVIPAATLEGCLCVSPLTDKFNDFNSRLEFAHRIALISDDIYECTSGLNIANILDPVCDAANPEPICREAAQIYLENWANSKVVQKALHIREGTIETWQKNNDSLHYDINKEDTVYYSFDIFSSVEYHRQLISRNSHVLILNGDHDMNFPYVGTEKWIKSLELPIKNPWKPWFVSNQIVGYKTTYAKNGYTLTYTTIKGAGHGVALYKPDEALAIVDGWFSSHSYLCDS
ncbi:putative peptidase S10, serine carboxypeptidase, alpha/Beta hydrolase [Helianthus annuus]|nr:putative peptidase S10, serine carboxypeptidase, alpha/Beta hydrolase [Helianthus annuus]